MLRKKKKPRVYFATCIQCGEQFQTESMRGGWFCSPACFRAYVAPKAPVQDAH